MGYLGSKHLASTEWMGTLRPVPDFPCKPCLNRIVNQGSPELQLKVRVAQSCPTLCDPMEFSRPEYWSGYPFPSLGDLPNPGIEPRSPTLQGDSLPAEPPGKPSVRL